MKKESLKVFLCLFILSWTMNVSASEMGFWTEDVWKAKSRPFLFYGEKETLKKKAAPQEKSAKDPLSSKAPKEFARSEEMAAMKELEAITTMPRLREVVKERLEAAVMKPNAQTIGLYLQANAFLMEKAGTFAQAWKKNLTALPQYDWTAVRPAVNAAAGIVKRESRENLHSTLMKMTQDWGFVMVADDSALTRLMSEILLDFATRFGFEVEFVSTTPFNSVLPQAKFVPGLADTLARGITHFPTVLLVHRNDKAPTDARIVATGVVDGEELARRTAAFVVDPMHDAKAKGWLQTQGT